MNPSQNSGPISEFLSTVHLAPRQSHKLLTIWPLVLNGSGATGRYVSAKDALDEGSIEIEEVDDHGVVSNVRVTNRGEKAALFLFGELLVGAKQNRVANATFLVPAESEVVIDVSCVEAGRWHARTRAFSMADVVLSSKIRKSMEGRVAASRRRGRSFEADQSEVWAKVGQRLTMSGTRSRSSDYAAYSSSRATDLEEAVAAFRPVEGQVGFVAAIGDSIEGAEIVGDPAVFAEMLPRLVRSYAIDAVDAGLLREAGEEPTPPDFDAPEAFLDALTGAAVERGPSLGEGEDLRLEGEHVTGCALHHRDLGVVHLTAFVGTRRWEGDDFEAVRERIRDLEDRARDRLSGARRRLRRRFAS